MTDLATLKLNVEADTSQVTKLATELKRTDRTAQEHQKTLSKSATVVERAMKLYEKYNTTLEKIERTHGRTSKAFMQGMSTINRLGTAINGMNSALIRTQREAAKAAAETDKLDRQGKKANVTFSKMHGTLNSLHGVLTGLGVGFLTRELIRVGNSFDRVRITLQTITGSTEESGKAFQFLQGLARQLGVDFLSLTDSYGQLAAATKNTGLEGEKMVGIFTAIAKTSAVMRWDVENTRGVMKAFEQMISKGTVQAEELRNQLGDRMPQAMGIFVRAFKGVSQSQKVSTDQMQEWRVEFNKAMKAGQVISEKILPEVAKRLEELFGPGVQLVANSAFAWINRMGNAFQNLADGAWTSGLEKAVANIAKSLTQLFENERVIAVVNALSKALGSLTQVLLDNGNALAGVLIGLTTFATSAIVLQIFNVAKAFLFMGGGVTKVTGILALLSVGVGALFTLLGGGKSGNPLDKAAASTDKLAFNMEGASKSTGLQVASIGDLNMSYQELIAASEKSNANLQSYLSTSEEVTKSTDETAKSFDYLKAISIAGIFLSATQAVKYLIPQMAKARDLITSTVASARSAGGTFLGGTAGASSGFLAGANRMVNGNLGQSFTFLGQASRESAMAARGMAAFNTQARVMARVMDVAVVGVRKFGSALAGVWTFLGGFPAVITAAVVALGYFVYQQKAATSEALDYIHALAEGGQASQEFAKTVEGTAARQAQVYENLAAEKDAEIARVKAEDVAKRSLAEAHMLELQARVSNERAFLKSIDPDFEGKIGQTNPMIPDAAVKRYTEMNNELVRLQANLNASAIALQNQIVKLGEASQAASNAATDIKAFGDADAEVVNKILEFEKRLNKKNANREMSDMAAMAEEIDDVLKNTKNLSEAGRQRLQQIRDMALAEDARQDSVKRLKEAQQDLETSTNRLAASERKYMEAAQLAGKSDLERIGIERQQAISEEADRLQEHIKLIKATGGTQEEVNAVVAKYLGIVRNLNDERDRSVSALRDEGTSMEKFIKDLEDEVRFTGSSTAEQKKLNREKKVEEALDRARAAAKADHQKFGERAITLSRDEEDAIRAKILAMLDEIEVRNKAMDQMEEWFDIFRRFKDDVDGISSDFFANLTLKGKSAWGMMLDDIKQSTARTFGELANMGVVRPFRDSLGSFLGGSGSFSSVLSSGANMASLTGMAKGGTSGSLLAAGGLGLNLAMGGGGMLFGSQTAANMGLMLANNGVMGAGANALIGGLQASPWGAIGALGANLLGLGGGTGGAIGGLVGSIGGAMAGTALGAQYGMALGPWGAVAGAFLGTIAGGLMNTRPSDRTQGSIYDPSNMSYRMNGLTGSRFSEENWNAARTFADEIKDFQNNLQTASGGTVNSGTIMAEFGDRDGLRVSGLGGWGAETFASADEAFRAVAKHFIRNLTGVSTNVATAIQHLTDDMSVERQIEILTFADNFNNAIEAMRQGSLETREIARLAAREQVKEITQQIKDFKAETEAAGLDTGLAATATKEYVEQLIGVRQAIEEGSPMSQAWDHLLGIFDEIGPLLDEVGIGASNAATLLTQAQQNITRAFDTDISRRLLEAQNPGAFRIQEIVDQWNSDIADAIKVGGNQTNVNALYDTLIRNALKGMSKEELEAVRTYFEGLESVSGPVNDALDAIITTLNDEKIAETAKAAAEFNDRMRRTIQELSAPGSSSAVDIRGWLADLTEAFSLGADTSLVNQAYILRQLNQENENRLKLIEDEIRLVEGNISAWDKMAKALGATRVGLRTNAELSPYSPLTILEDLRNQFNDASLRSKSTDAAVAQQGMEDMTVLSEQLLTASRAYFASSTGYLQDFDMVQQALADAETVAKNALSVEQSQLAELQGIRTALLDALNRPNGPIGRPTGPATGASYTAADFAVLNSQYGSAYAAAKSANKSDVEFINSDEFKAFESLRDTMIAGTSDEAYLRDSLAFAENQKNDPIWRDVATRYENVLRNRGKALGLQGFATGGMAEPGLRIVGERGPEIQLGGAARFMNASQTMDMLTRAMNGGASIGEIRHQTDVMAAGFNAVNNNLTSIREELQGIRRELKK